MRKSPTKTNEPLPLKEKPFIEPDAETFFIFTLLSQSSEIPQLSVWYICMYLHARGDIGRATLQEVGRELAKKEKRVGNRQERKRKGLLEYWKCGMRASPRAGIVQILGDSGSGRDRARGDWEGRRVSLFDIAEREARERERERAQRLTRECISLESLQGRFVIQSEECRNLRKICDISCNEVGKIIY